jgi:hypothetical protein
MASKEELQIAVQRISVAADALGLAYGEMQAASAELEDARARLSAAESRYALAQRQRAECLRAFREATLAGGRIDLASEESAPEGVIAPPGARDGTPVFPGALPDPAPLPPVPPLPQAPSSNTITDALRDFGSLDIPRHTAG